MDTSATTPTGKENQKNAAKKTSGGGISGYHMPWIERYRPRTLDDVVGNEETVGRLRAIAETGNLPNLILSGPPGSGKTTSVHALARQLLGNHYKDAVLELNASDARGIDVSSIVGYTQSNIGLDNAPHVFLNVFHFSILQVVRNRIKSFAMNKVTLPPGRYVVERVHYVALDEHTNNPTSPYLISLYTMQQTTATRLSFWTRPTA